jgi:hypothetical protein
MRPSQHAKDRRVAVTEMDALALHLNRQDRGARRLVGTENAMGRSVVDGGDALLPAADPVSVALTMKQLQSWGYA